MESFKSIMTCKSMLLLSILAINDSIYVNTASLHSIRNDFIYSDISGTGWRHDDVITKFIISMFCVLYPNKLLQPDWLSALTVWDRLWVNTADANIYRFCHTLFSKISYLTSVDPNWPPVTFHNWVFKIIQNGALIKLMFLVIFSRSLKSSIHYVF